MSVNIFGSSGGGRLPSDVDKQYVDQKFATLSTNLATKASKFGDTLQGDLNMNGNKIGNVAEPIHNLDLVSKRYVDEKFTNLYTLDKAGLVPALTSNRDKSGYFIYTSSELENHQGFRVFNNFKNASWKIASDNTTMFWIQLVCHKPVKVYMFDIKPTENCKIIKWKIQGNTDGFHEFEDLPISTKPLDGRDLLPNSFIISPHLTKQYLMYRIIVEEAEGSNPGLSYWQLYTVNDINPDLTLLQLH
jgi:hypothetical protein